MDFKTTRLKQLPVGSYIVAVSGGVDSVALLDMLVRSGDFAADSYKFIVAYFDHGIRADSAEDAKLVAKLAGKYNLQFETKREELGDKASEELARNRRYAFLRALAKKYQSKIITAHHADDAVETVAINISRGTGWRGLAILDSDIIRPLIDLSKSEIMDYAKQNKLQWHEDSTNADGAYLRNRMRQRLVALEDDNKRQILALRAQQIALKHDIDQEVTGLVGAGPAYSRYFFTHGDRLAMLECLRYLTNRQLTRPQLERVLIAIKTAKPRTIFEAGASVEFGFTSRNFTIKLIK